MVWELPDDAAREGYVRSQSVAGFVVLPCVLVGGITMSLGLRAGWPVWLAFAALVMPAFSLGLFWQLRAVRRGQRIPRSAWPTLSDTERWPMTARGYRSAFLVGLGLSIFSWFAVWIIYLGSGSVASALVTALVPLATSVLTWNMLRAWRYKRTQFTADDSEAC